MQVFGFWLHFYAIFFPFLLFSASYMHVHTSARLLTYMRVSGGAGVPERARIIFIFWTKNFQKFLSTSLFVGFAMICTFVHCGESGFLSFRHFVPPPSTDGGFLRRVGDATPYVNEIICDDEIFSAFRWNPRSMPLDEIKSSILQRRTSSRKRFHPHKWI